MQEVMLRHQNVITNAVKEKVSICVVVLTNNDLFSSISYYSDFYSKYPGVVLVY